MNSILQERKYCYHGGNCEGGLEKHHIFGGSNRKFSEEDGLWVWLCHKHHNEPPEGVHFDRYYMSLLHYAGQSAYEETHSRKQFVSRYGKNYIEDGNYDF